MTLVRTSACLKALSLLFASTVFAVTASGQATTGSISGHVVDSSGGVVQGAAVSIQNVDNGLITTATTNSSGDFTETALPPNTYMIVVEKSGFSNATVPAFKLDIDQRARFNIPMRVGEVSVNVTVTDSAPVLQVQGGETGQVIGSREIADLPTLGRDFSSLMLLVPGVVSGGGGNNLNLSVNGQREFSNSVQINGVEVTGNRNNDTNVRPSPDATEEFKVVTSSYAPEFGRASGGSVIIQTKSGTNKIHGSGYFFYRPTATAATGEFTPAGSAPPAIKQSNYGATIGGPILKDKAFLFLAYEGARSTDAYSYFGETLVGQNQVVFKANGDADLSKVIDPGSNTPVQIFDPYFFANNYYAQQFAGNIIPAADVSPAGKKIVQQLFPAPQNNNPYGNFLVTQTYKQNSNVANLRSDYTFSQNNRIYLTYDAEQGNSVTSDPFAGAIPVPGGGGADSGGYTSYENHAVALTYDHVFTPNLLNEARGTYFLSPVTQNSLLDGTNLATQFGIKNANIPGFPQTYGFPTIELSSGAVTGGSDYKPLVFRDKNIGFIESLSYTRGKHNAKFGYEYRHLSSHPQFAVEPVPYESFGAYPGFSGDSSYSTYIDKAYYPYGGAEIADLLLGLPQYMLQGLELTNPSTTANEHTFYLQDYWQISPRLNVTFGVRYEYLQPYVEASNNQANFDPATLHLNLAGRGSNSRSLVNANTTDFMPRVGVAYQLRPTTVIRAGYGKFYSPENDAREEILTQNYPFFITEGFYNDAYDLNYTLDAGVARPTSVTVPAGASFIDATTVPNSSSTDFSSEPNNFPTAYSQSYNVTVEQELGNATSVEVAFVGANTRDLSYKVGDYNINKRISSKIGKVPTLLPVGISNYESLQGKINRRFTRGYSLLMSYTWSHSLDNGPSPFNLGKGGDYPQNPLNVNAEYSNSDFDVRNNLVASQIIELPFGKGKRFLSHASGATNLLLGGWQLNSITTLHGGRPFNIVSNSSNANYPGLRPNLVGNPNVGHRTINQWFNPAAFSVDPKQAASTGAGKVLLPGNVPRNFLDGPGFTDEDLSLFKVLSLPREMKFQIRVEAFNVLNTGRLGQPNGNAFQTGTFGTITGGAQGENQRIMQFAGRLTF
jgi:Carboxypeptidase regulatory-like domain/TonB-dependent Receptor Plug Domain/TonB dependent receptor